MNTFDSGRIHLYTQRIDEALERLPMTSETARWRNELSALRKRLQDQSKLVAVFGAFSAGKSSLLNALLEDNTLVVSPNPTTAVVTQISQLARHGTVQVEIQAKTVAQLWDDVQQAFVSLHQPVSDIDDAIATAGSLRPGDFPPSARKVVSFLRSVAAGYDEMRSRLGTSWYVEASDIRVYTAEEKYACFLQRVHVPHNAQVLQHGISLVDTPGVDSIHRRHTDVAFDYMQAADAIVFVLYYTHAFSRSDKDFLQQLAGVQDVFGLNKLFVVINAVDLAKSEEERVEVRDRVKQELRQLGIPQPRVYEISSQLAFAASQLARDANDMRFQQLVRQRLRLAPDLPIPDPAALLQESGLVEFREQLLTYVQGESERLAHDALKRTFRTISRGLEVIVGRKLETMEQDAVALEDLRRRRDDFAQTLRQLKVDVAQGATPQEQALRADWEELVFHISQRIRFRLSTLFREAFHPGRFRDGGNAKLRLRESAEEFVQMLGRQVDVEGRTFALRTQQQVTQTTDRWLEQQSEHAAALGVYAEGLLELDGGSNEEFSADFRTSRDSASLDLTSMRTNLHWEPLERSFRHFSSAKQFFEQGGQGEMLKEVEDIAMLLITERVSELSTQICDAAAANYRERILFLIEKIESNLGMLESDGLAADDMDLNAVTGSAQWFANVELSGAFGPDTV